MPDAKTPTIGLEMQEGRFPRGENVGVLPIPFCHVTGQSLSGEKVFCVLLAWLINQFFDHEKNRWDLPAVIGGCTPDMMEFLSMIGADFQAFKTGAAYEVRIGDQKNPPKTLPLVVRMLPVCIEAGREGEFPMSPILVELMDAMGITWQKVTNGGEGDEERVFYLLEGDYGEPDIHIRDRLLGEIRGLGRRTPEEEQRYALREAERRVMNLNRAMQVVLQDY